MATRKKTPATETPSLLPDTAVSDTLAPASAAPAASAAPEPQNLFRRLHLKRDRIAICGGLRTPFSRSWSDLNDVDPVELSTQVARELLFRLELPKQAVDQVIWGTVISVVRSPNVAREVAMNLGMYHAHGFSVSRACASGFQSVASGCESIWAGTSDVVLCGGVDVTSHAPVTYKKSVVDKLQDLQKAKGMDLLKKASGLNPLDFLPSPPALTERYTGLTMGQHAEEMAQNFAISRQDQEALAITSHKNAYAAVQAGLIAPELITVQTPKGPVNADNLIRSDMDPQKLAKLKPVFDKRNGTITAATSSALTDGAACVLLARESRAKELGLPIVGYVRSYAFAGQDPRENMLLGNVYSTPIALDRAGLQLGAVDFIEIHEAFAAQVLSNLKMFKDDEFFKTKLGRDKALGEIDLAKLNVRGGSLAYGHPFAATGIRILNTMINTLRQNNKSIGLGTACAAGGMGSALVVEID
ncbi:MAG: acetyl-CoA C-acyltransferase [Deltaproteobacteria bacterium]|nr:acetyl-CoA C-acyltransferase [Deltaproteobacteria bacterium]